MVLKHFKCRGIISIWNNFKYVREQSLKRLRIKINVLMSVFCNVLKKKKKINQFIHAILF